MIFNNQNSKRERFKNAGWGKFCNICGKRFEEGICVNRHEQGEDYSNPTPKKGRKKKNKAA